MQSEGARPITKSTGTLTVNQNPIESSGTQRSSHPTTTTTTKQRPPKNDKQDGAEPHVACDDHAAELVYDEHVQLGRGLAELLLQDLQDGLHDPGRVSQGHGDVTQRPDGVVRDQVSVPGGRWGRKQSHT